MPKYRVQILVAPCTGLTAEAAQINRADIGEHHYEIEAQNGEEAEEKALDKFHSSVPIGILNNVTIDITHNIAAEELNGKEIIHELHNLNLRRKELITKFWWLVSDKDGKPVDPESLPSPRFIYGPWSFEGGVEPKMHTKRGDFPISQITLYPLTEHYAFHITCDWADVDENCLVVVQKDLGTMPEWARHYDETDTPACSLCGITAGPDFHLDHNNETICDECWDERMR